MAFNNYYIKINGNKFNDPLPSKYDIYPKLIQDMDSERTADGSLHRNILPHAPAKIELEFPPMKFEQFRAYYQAIDGNRLSVEYYDIATDSYKTAPMYHNDIKIGEINTGTGFRYIDRWSIHLIGY